MTSVQTLRFASPEVASRYPLPVGDPVAWLRCEGGWSATIALPDLANDFIVVPSFCEVGRPNAAFVCELRSAGAAWTLAPLRVDNDPATAPDARATTHIDYFHCRADLQAPTLTLTVATATIPHDYLLTVSLRPFRVAATAGERVTPRAIVPPISQLTAPRALRQRICSPTSVAMLLEFHTGAASLADATRACLHTPTGIYGVWPLAVRVLAEAGLIAAVECFSDLDDSVPLLVRGLPLVASIRFGAGALPGSPLTGGTDGHLVVVTGLAADVVYVNDPAAPDASSVPRAYPRAAFADAWLAQRGATYIAVPR